jgi:hypothetical protein
VRDYDTGLGDRWKTPALGELHLYKLSQGQLESQHQHLAVLKSWHSGI